MAQQELIFGQHAVSSLLTNESERVYELLVSKTRQDDKTNTLINLARKIGYPCTFLS